jgi:hypothetical protein
MIVLLRQYVLSRNILIEQLLTPPLSRDDGLHKSLEGRSSKGTCDHQLSALVIVAYLNQNSSKINHFKCGPQKGIKLLFPLSSCKSVVVEKGRSFESLPVLHK